MSQLDHEQIYKVLLRGLGKRLEVVAEQIMEIVEADRKAMREELTKEREARWEYEKGMADAQLQVIDLAGALKWYADEMNWIQGKWVDGAFVSRVGIDGGSLAQNALKLLEGNEPNEG